MASLSSAKSACNFCDVKLSCSDLCFFSGTSQEEGKETPNLCQNCPSLWSLSQQSWLIDLEMVLCTLCLLCKYPLLLKSEQGHLKSWIWFGLVCGDQWVTQLWDSWTDLNPLSGLSCYIYVPNSIFFFYLPHCYYDIGFEFIDVSLGLNSISLLWKSF